MWKEIQFQTSQFETNSGYESGDRVGTLDEKTKGKKSQGSVPLIEQIFFFKILSSRKNK